MPSDASCVGRLKPQFDGVGRSDDGHVAAAAAVNALAYGDTIETFGHDPVLLHQPAVLEDAHRVVVQNRRQQESFGVVRR